MLEGLSNAWGRLIKNHTTMTWVWYFFFILIFFFLSFLFVVHRILLTMLAELGWGGTGDWGLGETWWYEGARQPEPSQSRRFGAL